MHILNSRLNPSFHTLSVFTILLSLLFLFSCEKADIAVQGPDLITRANAFEHMTDLSVLMDNVKDVEVEITTHSSGYDALARGKGVIPTGEYAGHRFKVVISAHYSGVGLETLVTGEATVQIRSQKFESVEICDPGFESFCNGEGSLWDYGTHWEFTLFGQVEHLRASTPHNHLFAGLGSTAGTMNFNIVDQTGTVTEIPGGPNHDPNIGLIEDIPAKPVYVR